MRTQTDMSVEPALDPVPPSQAEDAIIHRPRRLPGLESVTAHTEDETWLHGALLGPFSGDIVDYLELARSTGGPVLDLGSGCGRLAVPFARHGFEVEAVDRNMDSLRRLRAWAEHSGHPLQSRITTTCADLTCLALRRRCQLALLAGAMISAVPPSGRRDLLGEIAAHLGVNGALTLDYTAHDAEGLAENPVRTWTFQVPRFDGLTEWVVARQVFEPTAMKEQITYRVERSDRPRTQKSIVTDKWIIDPMDLERDLRAAGLAIVDQRQQWLDERTRSVMLTCRPS